MGFRIVLLIRNLFSIDNSSFFPRIQYIWWNFGHSRFHFSKDVTSSCQCPVQIDTYVSCWFSLWNYAYKLT
jgi:hypothetical protein